MLVIRNAQMQALGEAPRRQFVERLSAHLRLQAPGPCAALSADALAAVVDHAIARAATHGIIAEADVGEFALVMSALGLHFDTDPRLPWAATCLDRSTHRHAAFRIADLQAATAAELQAHPELRIREFGPLPGEGLASKAPE